MCSLLVCAVTGTNGLVVATTVAAGVLASVLRRDESPVRTYVRYGALAILLVAAGEWLMWKPAPTSVSVFSAPAHQVATFAYHLVESSFATSASSGGWWRAPLIICLVVSGLVA